MLVAVLHNGRESIERDVDFSRGVFSAEGLGELSVDDLLELDAASQLSWIDHDVRMLALGFSGDIGVGRSDGACLADSQLRFEVETEVLYVPPHRVGSKTEAELRRIVDEMSERGWLLVEDTRVGASGGHLTFQRDEPIDEQVLRSLRCAG